MVGIDYLVSLIEDIYILCVYTRDIGPIMPTSYCISCTTVIILV